MEHARSSSDFDARAEDEEDIDIMRRAVQRPDELRSASTPTITSPSAVSFLTDDEDDVGNDYASSCKTVLRISHTRSSIMVPPLSRSSMPYVAPDNCAMCELLLTAQSLGKNVVESVRLITEHFSAHRVVLAATIPYFKAMFTSHMRESMQDEVHISGGRRMPVMFSSKAIRAQVVLCAWMAVWRQWMRRLCLHFYNTSTRAGCTSLYTMCKSSCWAQRILRSLTLSTHVTNTSSNACKVRACI